MNKNGPILVIEDDSDDQELLVDVFKELNYENTVLYFSDGHKAVEYLTDSDEKPFLILSDINMPKVNGFELRDLVRTNEKLSWKCIPYLFFTTTSSQKIVIDAYSKSVQGFFVKPASYDKLKKVIKIIVEYWKECEAPEYMKQVGEKT